VLILSRKPGESIVLGIASFAAMAEVGPMPPVPGDDGPSGGGEGSPPPCAAVAGAPVEANRGRAGSGRRRDRPPIKCGDRARSSE
jgi:hypothetical protein